MKDKHRRQFLNSAIGAGALLLPGTLAYAGPPSLSAKEKKRLKQELQRELERKVYNVDEKLFRKVNRARNPSRYEGHERGHVPKIVAPKKVRALEAFDVKIEVGVEEMHEMQVFHYIDWINLMVDRVIVGHTTLTPLMTQPVVTFQLTLEASATLTSQEHCALHGTWESPATRIEVIKNR
ncbi:MAG: desulfoferrodoxin family protein [Deltaproteobacteria bacterium]|jgi:desulfoferrodoxin-like iron-binding protein